MEDGKKSHDPGASSAARGSAAAVGEKDDDSSASEEEKPNTATPTRKDGRLYVEKNSLIESQLVAARDEARSELQRRTELGQATEDDIRKDKRAANRLSAFQSRKRRVGVLCDLEQKTTKLTQNNKEQASQILAQGEQIRRMIEENGRLREEIEDRKRRSTSSTTGSGGGDTTSAHDGAGGGQTKTAAGGGAATSSESSSQRESVESMLIHLQTLQKKQQTDRENLSLQQERDRKELSTAQRHQQEQLSTVQSQEQKQLTVTQQQDQRQLTSTQDNQIVGVLHSFGLPAGDRSEAMALLGELANTTSLTTLSTTAAAAAEADSANNADAPGPAGR